MQLHIVPELDFVPYTVTFALGLFVSVEVGLIAGTATHLCILLYKVCTPEIVYRVTGCRVKSVSYRAMYPGTNRVNEITDSVAYRVGLDIG